MTFLLFLIEGFWWDQSCTRDFWRKQILVGGLGWGLWCSPMGPHSVSPLLRLGWGGGLEFQNYGFTVEVKIFLISRWGVVPWGEGGIFHRGWSVRFPSILSFWNARLQKFKTFLSSCSIFTFSYLRHAGLQLDIDFNTESKFSLEFFLCKYVLSSSVYR